MDNTGVLATPILGNHHKHQPKVALFVLPTFEDVLSEVKHALLDSVSLLRDLHVLINLMREKCIRALSVYQMSYFIKDEIDNFFFLL